MASLPSSAELRRMNKVDLEQEKTRISNEVAVWKLSIVLEKQKDSAAYGYLKRHLARICTLLREKEFEEFALSNEKQ